MGVTGQGSNKNMGGTLPPLGVDKRHLTVSWPMRGKAATKAKVENLLKSAELWPSLTNAHLADKVGVSGNMVNAVLGGLGMYHALRSDPWWQEITYQRYQKGSPRTRLWYERIGYEPPVKLLNAQGRGFVPSAVTAGTGFKTPSVLEPELAEQVENHRTAPPQLPGYIDQEDQTPGQPGPIGPAEPPEEDDPTVVETPVWTDDPTEPVVPTHADLAEAQAAMEQFPMPNMVPDTAVRELAWHAINLAGGPNALGLVRKENVLDVLDAIESIVKLYARLGDMVDEVRSKLSS